MIGNEDGLNFERSKGIGYENRQNNQEGGVGSRYVFAVACIAWRVRAESGAEQRIDAGDEHEHRRIQNSIS